MPSPTLATPFPAAKNENNAWNLKKKKKNKEMKVMRAERLVVWSRGLDLNGPHGQEWELVQQRATVRSMAKVPRNHVGVII